MWKSVLLKRAAPVLPQGAMELYTRFMLGGMKKLQDYVNSDFDTRRSGISEAKNVIGTLLTEWENSGNDWTKLPEGFLKLVELGSINPNRINGHFIMLKDIYKDIVKLTSRREGKITTWDEVFKQLDNWDNVNNKSEVLDVINNIAKDKKATPPIKEKMQMYSHIIPDIIELGKYGFYYRLPEGVLDSEVKKYNKDNPERKYTKGKTKWFRYQEMSPSTSRSNKRMEENKHLSDYFESNVTVRTLLTPLTALFNLDKNVVEGEETFTVKPEADHIITELTDKKVKQFLTQVIELEPLFIKGAFGNMANTGLIKPTKGSVDFLWKYTQMLFNTNVDGTIHDQLEETLKELKSHSIQRSTGKATWIRAFLNTSNEVPERMRPTEEKDGNVIENRKKYDELSDEDKNDLYNAYKDSDFLKGKLNKVKGINIESQIKEKDGKYTLTQQGKKALKQKVAEDPTAEKKKLIPLMDRYKKSFKDFDIDKPFDNQKRKTIIKLFDREDSSALDVLEDFKVSTEGLKPLEAALAGIIYRLLDMDESVKETLLQHTQDESTSFIYMLSQLLEAFHMNKELTKLTNNLDKFESGDYDFDNDPPFTDEIKELSTILHDILVAIQSRFKEEIETKLKELVSNPNAYNPATVAKLLEYEILEEIGHEE
mgnify:CR=1 FL=1